MKTYTVISLEEYEREVQTLTVEAESPYHAMCKAAAFWRDEDTVIGAFESVIETGAGTLRSVELHTPGVDNNSPAAARDLCDLHDCWRYQ